MINKENKDSKIIIVSGYTKKTIFLNISRGLKNTAILLLCVVLGSVSVYSAGTIGDILQLQKDVTTANQTIDKLLASNEQQKNEVDTLLSKTTQLQEEVVSNTETLGSMKQSVGLKTNEGNIALADFELTSRSLIADIDLSNTLDEINTSISVIASEIDTQTADLQKSSKDIASRIAYMKAVPSGKPLQDKMAAAFGYRTNAITKRGSEFHKGVDLGGKMGASIRATADGVVIFSGVNGGYGKLIKIDHGYGFVTYYAHCSELIAQVGDKVKKGDIVSKVGNTGRSTGPHVHYEVRINNKAVNPADYF